MSVLVLQLPPRERLASRAGGADIGGGAALRLPAEWDYALSADGRTLTQQGSAALGLLPRADETVLVLAESDVSWHRIDVPKAPAARLRAALLGVMEEALLEDDESLHFALAEGSAPGKPGWVAVTHGPRLRTALAALEGGGRSVERVVAASQPAPEPRGHFHTLQGSPSGDKDVTWLSLARPEGVASLRLQGGLARALLPDEGTAVRWTSTPAAAATAERWLGAAVALQTDAERALEAAQGGSNLRQFNLAARHRGTRALRELGKRLLSHEWRAVRWGLAGLVAVQLLGLNVYAWQQEQALAARRVAMNTLLRSAHPGVRAVLDAPLQMQRETERLRVAAGRPSDADFEALMGAAAAAWPVGQGPVQTLRFESGRLLLAAPGFGAPQLVQLRDRLKGSGYAVELSEGRVVVSRAAPAARAGA